MAEAAGAKKDFFISYNKADRQLAEWIAWQLEEAKYAVVIQAWDFRPSTNFVLQMQQATANTERTLAVLSPDYLAALYTQPEWAAAFAKDPTGQKGTLLLVRVRECDPTGLLPQVTWIDLVGLKEDLAKKALLDGVRRDRAKPAAPPAFVPAETRTITEKPPFPVGLPPVFSVPQLRNPNFTGRVAILKNLRKALTSGKTAALTQAIHGLGGVGKTQLALEYAYRHAADYKIIWWVRSENTAQLASDYAALATALALPEKDDQNQSKIVAAVRQRLEHTGEWLLVFDNVADPADLHDLLPRGGTGHVIVTSRNPHWKGMAKPLPVEIFERGESVKFLLKRTGATDKKAADALADALGDLPLALEHAAAYVESTGISLGQYLKLFEGRTGEMLAFCEANPDYPCAVATTWLVSMEIAEKECPAAGSFLNLCAFFAPDEIPLEILPEAKSLPKRLAVAVKDPLKLNNTVAALKRFSLILTSAEGKAISIHRLVQAVVRDRMPAKEVARWSEAAVRIINEAFPYDSDDVRTWPVCGRLVAHALAAADHAERTGLASGTTGQLLNQVGGYTRGVAQLESSKAAFEGAMRCAEKAFGPNSPQVAACINNLGLVLHGLGDLVGARTNFERALMINEATAGSDHPAVANVVNNLGLVFKALDDLAAARAAFERALKIDEAAYGSDHPAVARDVNNLGGVLRDLGDLAGARAAFERALKIDEAAYGPNHPIVAIRVNNLGGVLCDLGDLAGARASVERALKIDEAAYGPNHPDVATRLNNLGSVLQDQGDLAGARTAFERALRIFRKFLGDEHPTSAHIRKNLESLDRRK